MTPEERAELFFYDFGHSDPVKVLAAVISQAENDALERAAKFAQEWHYFHSDPDLMAKNLASEIRALKHPD